MYVRPNKFKSPIEQLSAAEVSDNNYASDSDNNDESKAIASLNSHERSTSEIVVTDRFNIHIFRLQNQYYLEPGLRGYLIEECH